MIKMSQDGYKDQIEAWIIPHPVPILPYPFHPVNVWGADGWTCASRSCRGELPRLLAKIFAEEQDSEG